MENKTGKRMSLFVTYNDFLNAIDTGIKEIIRSGITIDAIVPVLRSGMVPSFKIAEKLHVPILIDGKLYGGQRIKKTKDINNILLVDDSIFSGGSLNRAAAPYRNKYNVYTYCVISTTKKKNTLDFYSIEMNHPRVFEWNMFHALMTSRIMFDMDGLLCEDPKVFDDDGISYENEIKSLKPLYIPKRRVHSIVTNRIERWRDITVDWLDKHNIQYGKLIMQDFDTAAERRKKSNPAEYKAKHYKNSNAVLYIESHDNIARNLNKLTGKPTYSVQSNKYFK